MCLKYTVITVNNVVQEWYVLIQESRVCMIILNQYIFHLIILLCLSYKLEGGK